MKRYLLTSESSIKRSVVEKRLTSSNIELVCENIPTLNIKDNVEQPIGIGGLICCKNRIIASLANKDYTKYNVIISIENAVDSNLKNEYWDEVHVMLFDCETGIYYYDHGAPVYFLQM
jgi:hypothetical protein